MNAARPGSLGVLDWGIGGLDVLRKLREHGDTRSVLYVSDAGCTPYGKMPTALLAARVAHVLRWMRAQGCTSAVVGCNAASTVLHEAPVARLATEGFAVRGVIEVAVDAVLREGTAHVLIIGGERTVQSDAHATALRRRATGELHLVTRVAQPLSALIEAGTLRGPALHSCLAKIFEGATAATTLVSACTHYVAVEAEMRALLPHLQVFIDPAALLAASLAQRHATPQQRCPPDRFVTTGDPTASRRAAQAAFGYHAPFETAPKPLLDSTLRMPEEHPPFDERLR